MSDAAAVQARLIGAIFVERGLISDADLEEALGKQAQTGERLGEILVADYGVSRLELASVLAEQWADLEQHDPKAQVAAAETIAAPQPAPVAAAPQDEEEEQGPAQDRRPIGEIFVERGFITQEQLQRALEAQRESGQRLGEILVQQGSISRLDLAGALAEQWAGLQKLRPPEPRTAAEPWQQRSQVEHEQTSQIERQRRDETLAELGEVRRAISALEDRLRLAEQAAGGARWQEELQASSEAISSRLDGLEARLGGLATREELEAIGDLRVAIAETRAAAAASSTRMDEIAKRLEQLGQASTAAADQAALDALRSELQELGTIVQRAEGAPEALRALEERLDADLGGFRETVDALGTRWAAELADAVSVLGSRIEGIETGAADRFVIEEFSRELHRLAEPALAAQRLADDLAALAGRVDEELAGRENDAAARGEQLAWLEGELAELRRRSEGIAAAEDRLEGLSARVEELSATGLAPSGDIGAAVAEAERRAAERHAALEQSVSARLEDLAGTAVRREEIESLTAVVRALEEQSAANPDLQERVSLLAVRVQALADADGAALADLQSTLEELVQRDSSELPERIAAVESRLSDFELAVRQHVDETLTVERAAREGIAVRLDDTVKRLAELQVLAEKVETLDERMHHLGAGEIETLRGRLESIDGLVADGVRRQEDLLAEAEALSAQLEELASSAAAVDRLAAGQAALEERAAGLDARVEGLVSRPELDGLTADLRAQLGAIERSPAGDVTAPELAALRDELASDRMRVSELRDAVAAGQATLAGGLTELEQMTAALSARVAGHEDIAGELAGLRSELEARLAETVSRPELAGLAGDLRAQLQAIEEASTRQVSALNETAATLAARVDAHDALATAVSQLRTELQTRADAGEVTALRAQLDESRAAVAELAERAADAAVRSEVAETTEGLRAQMRALEQELAGGATAAELSAIRQNLAAEQARTTELSDALAGGQETLVAKLSQLELTTSALAERVASHDEVVGRLSQLGSELQATRRRVDERDAGLTEIRAAIGTVTEAVDNLSERSATDVGELAARIDDVAIRSAAETAQGLADLRQEIGTGVRKELESTVSSMGWRLAKLEERLTGPDAGNLDARVTQLEQGQASLHELSEAQALAVERAVRKGLKALAAQMATSEAAVIAARDTFRQSLEVLETAATDTGTSALAPVAEGTEAEPGYVAFVPRSDGYRLTDMTGPVVAVGDRIEAPDGSRSLVATRVGRSPLPFDERACVYFEPAAA